MNPNDLELKIAKLLRVGVIIAGVIIAIGWLWSLSLHQVNLFEFKDYAQVSLMDSVRHCLEQREYSTLITYVGLGVLVCLPVLRVLLTGILFLVQKEKILGWTALAVFAVLVGSFLLGARV